MKFEYFKWLLTLGLVAAAPLAWSLEPGGMSRAEFAQFLKNEDARWGSWYVIQVRETTGRACRFSAERAEAPQTVQFARRHERRGCRRG